MVKMSLAAARVNKGLTQKEASKALCISNKTLCNWEAGKSFPNAAQIKELCALYDLPYDSIEFCP